MGKRKPAYSQAIQILQELYKLYPTHTLGQHIATALVDYRDTWGVSDKEFLFALEKYKTELEFNVVPDKEIETILKEGQDLDKLFIEDEYEED